MKKKNPYRYSFIILQESICKQLEIFNMSWFKTNLSFYFTFFEIFSKTTRKKILKMIKNIKKNPRNDKCSLRFQFIIFLYFITFFQDFSAIKNVNFGVFQL